MSDHSYYKPLTEVGASQRYNRTAPIICYLKDAALKNKVTLNELLRSVLRQVNYNQDNAVSDIGRQLIEVQPKSISLSYDQTTNLKQGLKIRQD